MGKGFLDFDAVTTNDLLRTVKENKNRFPLDSDLNEFSEKLLPNSVISREINKIKDATSNNKGYFLNVESLKDAYPTTNEGSKAYVGNSYPYMIYLFQGGEWINSGQAGGDDTFNAGDFYTKLQIDQQREVINGEISRVEKGANYEILKYEVNIATTRLKVDEKNRKGGYMITYNPGTGWIKEQYIGNSVTNDEWIKDENWKTVLEDSGIQAIAEDARHQAQVAQASSIEAATQAQYAKEQAQAAQAVVGSIFESAPINTIMRTTKEAGNIFGENWLKCDGSQVSAIDYPLLRAKVSSSTWETIENTYGITKCAYGNGIYVAIGTNKTVTSTDGINWEEHTTSFTAKYIVYFDGYFYCDSNVEGEYIVKSIDGVSWSKMQGFFESITDNKEEAVEVKEIKADDTYLFVNFHYTNIDGVLHAGVSLLKDGVFSVSPYYPDEDFKIGGSYGDFGLLVFSEYTADSSKRIRAFKIDGSRKSIDIPTEYTEYFKNGWIGCEYLNGKYVIATSYYINESEGCAIFTTTNGDDLTKVYNDDSVAYFMNLVNDKNRLLLFYGGTTKESTSGNVWNETNIPSSGYYCRGDKMIVIDDTSIGSNNINYSIDNIQLPNIENHYIKAKQP